jgi:hypothetical protein
LPVLPEAEDYVGAALAVAESLASDGSRAEITSLPEIFEDCLIPPRASGDRRRFRELGPWHGAAFSRRRQALGRVGRPGPRPERMPLTSIVGFGIGGDETGGPAAPSAGST